MKTNTEIDTLELMQGWSPQQENSLDLRIYRHFNEKGRHQNHYGTFEHVSPMAFLGRILGRPRNERAYMLIATGYPGQGCEVPDLERKPLERIMTEV